MADLYNQEIAKHYASYRPPLHKVILKRIFSARNRFETGLDVGCGTGDSTIALAKYCSTVIGIDPSQFMIDRAAEHPKITYVKGSGEDIPLPENSIDVVSFAGSLFYIDLDMVASELQRVCRKDAVIIVYDFEILMGDILASLHIPETDIHSEYDHSLNFSGIDPFKEITSEQDQISIILSSSELAHVLLSDHNRYKAFTEKYSSDHPFEKLKNELNVFVDQMSLIAVIFYSKRALQNKIS